MRSRIPLFALLLIAGSLVLPLAAHAGIPFFGPIIPPQSVSGIQGSDTCAAGWGMLIMVINNIIALLITLAIVFVAPLMIAYAGFLLVVSQGDSGKRTEARKILMNTIIGIVIALAGWMIVDAIMLVLYNPNAESGTTKLTAWSQLITSGDISKTGCIKLAGSLSQAAQQNTDGINAGALNAPPSGKTGTACDPSVVQAAAKTGWPQYPLSNTQANTFACIAKPESNCGTPKNPPNYNWNGAKSLPASTAAGAFQVLLASNHICYENSACYAAAGVNGPLNCQNGFESGSTNPNLGKPKTDSNGNPIPIVQTCVTAANNLNCSASAAACLLQQSGGNFKDWQQDVNSAVQTGCINGA